MANRMHPDTWIAVTPKDTAPLGYTATSLYIGVTGDVTVTQLTGGKVLFKNAVQGSYIIGDFIKVWRTGTTATNILAAKLNT